MKYLFVTIILLFCGCSAIKKDLDGMISPTGAYYDNFDKDGKPIK